MLLLEIMCQDEPIADNGTISKQVNLINSLAHDRTNTWWKRNKTHVPIPSIIGLVTVVDHYIPLSRSLPQSPLFKDCFRAIRFCQTSAFFHQHWIGYIIAKNRRALERLISRVLNFLYKCFGLFMTTVLFVS